MSPFWQFARQLLRHRGTCIAALIMAFVSAGGLGVGLIGVVQVLRGILPTDGAPVPGLAEQATALNAKIGGLFPQSWIDLLPEGRFETVVFIVLGLGVLTIIGAAANFMHAYLSLTVCVRTMADIRNQMFRHVLALPLATVVQRSSSDLTSRILTDTGELNLGFQALTSKAVAQVTKAIAGLLAALVISFWLSVVTLLVAPLLYVIIRKLGKRIRRATRSAMESRARLLGVLTETMHGFRVVKVHVAEPYEMERFATHNASVVRETLRVRTARALASPLLETITMFVIAGMALVAAKQIIDGAINAEQFIGALAALGVAGSQLKPLTGVIHQIQMADAAARRIEQVLKTGTEHKDEAGKAILAVHRKSITFKDVTFTYPRAVRPALMGVSLEVVHGETIAIVGPNGSGKTTMLALVPRLFIPDSGRIQIDDVDLESVTLESLRRQIGMVTQETVLFPGTIASNIAYGKADATADQIRDAARRARAEEFILQTARGYDTPVGDLGQTLSGGQRQRLAIARAILRDPAILIMDEATSMIDSESEAKITDAIAEFSRQRTTLIVAHRLSTVINADRIVVLDQGRIVDIGPHDQLIERCGVYQQLARRQLQPMEA